MSSRPFIGNDVEVGMDRGREEGIPDGWLPEQAAIDLAITDNFSYNFFLVVYSKILGNPS